MGGRLQLLVPGLVVIGLGLLATFAGSGATAGGAVVGPPGQSPPTGARAQAAPPGITPTPTPTPTPVAATTATAPRPPQSPGQVRPAAATPRTLTFAYDANGRLTGVDYGAGTTIRYRYDANGNLLGVDQVGIAATATPTATAGAGTATPTATPTGPVTVATVQPTPGATQTVAIPEGQGSVLVPGDAAGSSPLTVTVRTVPTTTLVAPAGMTLLRAVDIAFVHATTGQGVTDLEREVTIELSYAGLGLREEQLDRLVIYNAGRSEYLTTTIDRTRQVASARTRRFSGFVLAELTSPVPRAFGPVVLNQAGGGW